MRSDPNVIIVIKLFLKYKLTCNQGTHSREKPFNYDYYDKSLVLTCKILNLNRSIFQFVRSDNIIVVHQYGPTFNTICSFTSHMTIYGRGHVHVPFRKNAEERPCGPMSVTSEAKVFLTK